MRETRHVRLVLEPRRALKSSRRRGERERDERERGGIKVGVFDEKKKILPLSCLLSCLPFISAAQAARSSRYGGGRVRVGHSC